MAVSHLPAQRPLRFGEGRLRLRDVSFLTRGEIRTNCHRLGLEISEDRRLLSSDFVVTGPARPVMAVKSWIERLAD